MERGSAHDGWCWSGMGGKNGSYPRAIQLSFTRSQPGAPRTSSAGQDEDGHSMLKKLQDRAMGVPPGKAELVALWW